MDNKIFPEGLFFNEPHENAPDFVKGRLAIDIEKFTNFLKNNKHLADKKGYMKFDLLEGRSGRYYAAVNTYKPEAKPVELIKETIDKGGVPF
mgnify:CR=1 FL=1